MHALSRALLISTFLTAAAAPAAKAVEPVTISALFAAYTAVKKAYADLEDKTTSSRQEEWKVTNEKLNLITASQGIIAHKIDSLNSRIENNTAIIRSDIKTVSVGNLLDRSYGSLVSVARAGQEVGFSAVDLDRTSKARMDLQQLALELTSAAARGNADDETDIGRTGLLAVTAHLQAQALMRLQEIEQAQMAQLAAPFRNGPYQQITGDLRQAVGLLDANAKAYMANKSAELSEADKTLDQHSLGHLVRLEVNNPFSDGIISRTARTQPFSEITGRRELPTSGGGMAACAAGGFWLFGPPGLLLGLLCGGGGHEDIRGTFVWELGDELTLNNEMMTNGRTLAVSVVNPHPAAPAKLPSPAADCGTCAVVDPDNLTVRRDLEVDNVNQMLTKIGMAARQQEAVRAMSDMLAATDQLLDDTTRLALLEQSSRLASLPEGSTEVVSR